jgi:nucleotide-binding universal stress UspA family protein
MSSLPALSWEKEMAYRDLLVLVGIGGDGARSYALWLAGACGATLTAAAPVVSPSLPPYIAAEMPNDVLARIQEDAETAANKALNEFMEAARQANVPAETLGFKANAGAIGDAVSRLARCFDATILPQPDPTGVDTSYIVETALFGSAHPLIIVPYIQARPEIGTALIAWDGGEPSARAVADALPILTLARRVEIVTIGNGKDESPYLSGRDLTRHLARHGIKAEPRRIARGDVDVGNILLSHAADAGADLIVMGGYGHSRLREIVLGGTTREIIRSMTVPVLMSH